jgi:hypothetical protein
MLNNPFSEISGLIESKEYTNEKQQTSGLCFKRLIVLKFHSVSYAVHLLFNLNRDSPVSVFLTWLSLLKMG